MTAVEVLLEVASRELAGVLAGSLEVRDLQALPKLVEALAFGLAAALELGFSEAEELRQEAFARFLDELKDPKGPWGPKGEARVLWIQEGLETALLGWARAWAGAWKESLRRRLPEPLARQLRAIRAKASRGEKITPWEKSLMERFGENWGYGPASIEALLEEAPWLEPGVDPREIEAA